MRIESNIQEPPVIQEKNPAQSFKIGNTHIKIFDDFCKDKSPADIEAILKRIAERAQSQLSAQTRNQEAISAASFRACSESYRRV